MLSINDSVYGFVSLDEPLLEAIIATSAMQRLAHVSQSGISGRLGISPNYSRLEHSIGVMLLLRRLGASLREQAAGLLHDISHTAFSHVADFVYANHSESYHESMWWTVVEQSEIPAILAAAGYDWRDLHAESGDFTLLEQSAPRLCADRGDYFLRTLVPSGLGTAETVTRILDHLIVYDGVMAVDDVAVARLMADAYQQMDARMWSSPREVALYWVLAAAMRRAVQIGAVQESDWYQTDAALWAQLHAIDDADIQNLLTYVRPTSQVWVT
jgi:HD superfamily phosphohydrolase